jgi:dipeptidyl aminopeptidase/acylaminoacyl peptidase
LLNTTNGEIIQIENIQTFQFSDDSKWIAYLYFKKDDKVKDTEAGENKDHGRDQKGKKSNQKLKKNVGSDLVLRNLQTEDEFTYHFIKTSIFDKNSTYLVFTRIDTSWRENGVYFMDLKKNELQQQVIAKRENGTYDHLTWNDNNNQLAFLSGILDEKENPQEIVLTIWDTRSKKSNEVLSKGNLPDGWIIYEKNNLRWTKDGKRLFLGIKPESEIILPEDEKKDEEKIDLFDVERILDGKEVDVWHWNDPLINPNQKKSWSRIKDRTYPGVYHLDDKKFIQLTDKKMPNLTYTENPNYALGNSNIPYQKMITWYGRVNDYYLVDLKEGKKKKIITKLDHRATLSPGGNYIVYYENKHWYLLNTKSGMKKNLTENLRVPFYNEDHDYPQPVPGYGIGGWTKEDQDIFIYDKYDIWQFPTEQGEPIRLTNGRKDRFIFRIQRLKPDQRFYQKGEILFLTAYHDCKKYTAFYAAQVGQVGVKPLIEEAKKYTLLSKAKKADQLLYTCQSYTEFPDLWVADLELNHRKKITNENPQIKDFAWGEAELVEWFSADGKPLQGVLIKPGNYEKGKKYPVLVYYYRFFSQRLHEFNQVVINHRPCFPFYASHGYAVFLPDIRFEIGRPGLAATKCLVPGIQKIINLGIADPDAIALHGHSWSGYQTAFVVTQTDLFACAIAGAPVSNMTSAYGGIRWGSGLARQFQYEQSQSRIGGTLWNALNKYIENSPLFYVDRINTPLLVMHGDVDDAVPWYQSIELYLGMRRFEKDCIFLQYRNEPHHPRKYANKLDYTLKMKEYLDHYLKGKPAADWISKGMPYQGK